MYKGSEHFFVSESNCEFSLRVRKLLIRKLILLIAHPYVQFAQTQLLLYQAISAGIGQAGPAMAGPFSAEVET